MGRRKIPITYITDDRKRASTFDKRRIGLFKKASELNLLCGVNISVIIVHGNSTYKFSNAADAVVDDQSRKRPEKVEEAFTTDSLWEFINKKHQKSANTAGSDSIDRQSVCDDHNALLTDDDDDSRFNNELELYNLLDSYNNIRPPTSPATNRPELTLLTSRRDSAEKATQSAPIAFSFDAIDQFSPEPMKSAYGIPPINRIRMANCSGIVDNQNSFAKSDVLYNELAPISGPKADDSYSAPNAVSDLTNDSISNSRWRNHRSFHPQMSELYFSSTSEYDISLSGLDTPVFESYNTDQLQHLNSGLPTNFHDPFEGPISKRQKILIDSP